MRHMGPQSQALCPVDIFVSIYYFQGIRQEKGRILTDAGHRPHSAIQDREQRATLSYAGQRAQSTLSYAGQRTQGHTQLCRTQSTLSYAGHRSQGHTWLCRTQAHTQLRSAKLTSREKPLPPSTLPPTYLVDEAPCGRACQHVIAL